MTQISRRNIAKGAAWSVPAVAVASATPAIAASTTPPVFDIVFDGGGGANGAMNSVYINFGSTNGTKGTLANAVVVAFNVVGLNSNAAAYERSFTAGSSLGSLVRSKYDRSTLTTSFVWTIPAGTAYDAATSGNIDALLSFGDGLSGGGRITNKIVVTSVTGTAIASPLPLDSSVVGDVKKGAVSPDGIY